jgi:hypothetical protein
LEIELEKLELERLENNFQRTLAKCSRPIPGSNATSEEDVERWVQTCWLLECCSRGSRTMKIITNIDIHFVILP